MSDQTTLDLTEKQPTALMRLEAVVIDKKINDVYSRVLHERYVTGYHDAIKHVLEAINEMKPSELADLKRSFCEGGIETESAETWSKKWGVNGC